MEAVYICAAKRTPVGSFGGVYKRVTAVELGVAAVKALLAEELFPHVEELIFGNVLSAGLGQAPARQVALAAGLKESTRALTVNKVCSSGLKAVMLAADSIALGRSELVVAGGMENMSLAPFLSQSQRYGSRLGHTELKDSILLDALWDVYNDFHMGNAGELCAEKYSLSREMQDEYALESYRRANLAIEKGYFDAEIAAVNILNRGTETSVEVDEEPGRLNASKVSSLRAVFKENGTITAANASPLNDGAAALLIASESALKKFSLTPLARILSQGSFGKVPAEFTTAPVGALSNALESANLEIKDIDLFEINEAFSCVAMACSHELSIPKEKLNICGGAVALGHPLGASGAKILCTLLHSLLREKKRYGAVGICNGGGEATALVLERL
ncbi:UNVERIFIED_CONTAM: hypothetical protein GTU68_032920 [Idotea baltica]|nr:hypothetical protein [Idotea baltica]